MSKNKDLASAYAVASRRKKMASGGKVEEKSAPHGAPQVIDSPLGLGKIIIVGKAEGGMVEEPQMKPKMQMKKHAMIVKGSGFTSKLRDQEADQMESMKPNEGVQRQPIEMYNEKDADKEGASMPAEQKIDEMRMMKANGGVISLEDAEEDREEHPAGLEQDDDQMRPPQKRYMADHNQMLAEGGEVKSVADAIMERRRAKQASEQVDIEMNAQEMPNQYYGRNKDVLKENYDQDMMDVSQPMDSNEHSVEIDSDKHDRISEMRRRMKKRI